MAAETDRNRDILRLNALVDGELSAVERAALASRLATDRDLARAHATLATLKACVVASAEAAPVPLFPELSPRRPLPRWGLAVAWVAVAGLIGLVGLDIAAWESEPDSGLESPHTIVALAALPANPVVPDLALAGLKLAGIASEAPGGVPAVVATYLGPRGCRLVLRVHRADTALPAIGGTRRRSWTVDHLAYELTAFGMPGLRFDAVAAAAENATRAGGMPGDGRKLRQAGLASPPCVG
jgi:anti-sigma factor RsiW